jgi:hypothetical protein
VHSEQQEDERAPSFQVRSPVATQSELFYADVALDPDYP